MRVLLIGNGGREAALAWRLVRSPSVSSLVATGPNPGWPDGVEVASAPDVTAMVDRARELRPDLVVVGPEAPLAAGVADRVRALGIPCFGPGAAAARIEASKAFAKEIMARAGVPTAGSLTVGPGDLAAARARLDRGDVVVKADGLAAGKGVIVCRTAAEAHAAFDAMTSGRFGEAASSIVLEDRLEGPEISVFGLSDGARAVGLPSCQDHKALLDGGLGPNTGGMGAYAPVPGYGPAAVAEIVRTVHEPVLAALAEVGAPFRGVLYAGLMITADGPKVLEFNARFGDPECQVLMALWGDDPVPWLLGAARGALPAGAPRFDDGAACCVVLAAGGYPEDPERGVVIPEGGPVDGTVVFHAGTRRDPDGTLRTAGGRVLGITGVGPDLGVARSRAYAAVDGWRFAGCQVRGDIGAAGLP